MKRFLTLAALAVVAVAPLAASSAEAFVGLRSARVASAKGGEPAIGLRADQLKFGSKRWFEQMEREGRFGGPRG
jgi:hypothetical protein